MSTALAEPTALISSPPSDSVQTTRDEYRFGRGPAPTLQAGTMGWSSADLEDQEVYYRYAAGRYEIHHGVLVAMPPSLFYSGAAASNLTYVIRPYLKDRGLSPSFAPEVDIAVEPPHVVRGDYVGVWGDDRGKFDVLTFPPPRPHWSQHILTLPPTLIIEAVSQGHEQHDRQTKRRWYADLGVRHYWIVDGLRRMLDCLLLDGDTYTEEAAGRDGETINPPSLPGLAIPLLDVWSR